MRLAVVFLATLVASCQGAPAAPTNLAAQPSPASTSSPSTIATASPSRATDPTPDATPAATSTPSPTARPIAVARFRPDSFVEVVTNDLRMRSKPGVSDESRKLEPLLWKGALAFVLDGPVSASGYDWYLINPLGEADLSIHADPPPLGWVAAASKDGKPWLEAWTIPCPADPLEGAPGDGFDWPSHGLIGLNCFGDAEYRFFGEMLGTTTDCDPAPAWRTEPEWFDPYCGPVGYVIAPDRGGYPALPVVVEPGTDLGPIEGPDIGVWVSVTVSGQYDHPAAQTCRSVRGNESSEPKPAAKLVTLACRSQFVVTSIGR
jgi:hypothetical protein